MTSEKGDFPSTLDHVDPIGEQDAGRRDINGKVPHYPTGGGSSSTSGQVYDYDQSADRGIPHYTPRPDNTTAAPPPYQPWGPPAPAVGNVYAYDQPGMQSNVVVMQQPGPMIVHTHLDPGVEAGYTNILMLSICLWFCCSWLVGIFAIIFAIKARNAARLGLMDDAKSYANCAKGWMVATVITGVICTVLIVMIRVNMMNNY